MEIKDYLIKTNSPEETIGFGTVLGEHLEPGSVVALTGDFGSGKTCLTQGIARGLNVPGHIYVTSPSFTLINEYPGRIPLFHIDLYRLENESEWEEIGIDEVLSGEGVVVIEWAEKVCHRLPREHLLILIDTISDNSRTFKLRGHGEKIIDLVNHALAKWKAKDN
nr:tRNA (adenosine(37)-N6)-threonylcarbamoyltransferase complex ATPase subunit type 1 TsaE [Desulfobacterales bacterium]